MRRIATAGAGATMALTASFTLAATPAGAQSYYDFAQPHPGQLPAVSTPNWKLQLGGGVHDDVFKDGSTFDARASYAMPLSYTTGFQVDGLLAPVGGEFWAAAAGHYFWRDPAVGLSGIYGSANSYNGVGWGVLGYEAEVYFRRVSVDFLLGFTFGGVDTEILNETRLGYYVTDDFVVQAGYRHESGEDYFLTRAEYQIAPAAYGTAVFIDGRWSNGHDAILAGLRFHFGEGPKSLIRRHREGDPPQDFLNLNAQAADEGMSLIVQAPSGGSGGGKVVASDARLKRDIVLVAALAHGINLYAYRYVGGLRRCLGVMAQEVMQVLPHAVRRGANGYYAVDYGAVFAEPALRAALRRQGYELAEA